MDHSIGSRGELYPDIEPYGSGMLKLDRVHEMYWETSGNESGIPVLFLHGGPGAGSAPAHRRFFVFVFYQNSVRNHLREQGI